MAIERLSSDKLSQLSVAETVRRVDGMLEVILLRSGPLYLPGRLRLYARDSGMYHDFIIFYFIFFSFALYFVYEFDD